MSSLILSHTLHLVYPTMTTYHYSHHTGPSHQYFLPDYHMCLLTGFPTNTLSPQNTACFSSSQDDLSESSSVFLSHLEHKTSSWPWWLLHPHPTPVTLATLPFLEPAKLWYPRGDLLSLHGMLSVNIHISDCFTSFRSLFKCQSRKVFPNHHN